ncbi:MAG: hypothetical protein M1548_05835, partial [Actinobacteria bacterium]|nr:hypothetical protein [Actinomycetota bacterium]
TNGYSSNPSISADGSYVAFSSDATNLVDGDTNSTRDVFVRNLQTGSTKRVSISSTRGQGNGWSDYSSISADGRYIVFKSAADNLILGDTNRDLDAFVQDQMTGETMRVNVSSSGAEGNRGHRGFPSISANGRYVVFASDANNLVDNDTNGQTDVFVHDRLPVPRSVTNLDGALVQNNWFSSNVTVALSATDTPGGSGVARTQYSFNGSTWDTYTVPFLVSAEGTTTVFYRSVDNAGNVEATKQQIIKIDKTAPTVSTTIVSANVNRSKGQVAQVNVSANEPGTYHVDIYRNLGGGARGAKVYSADLGEVSSIIWDGKDNAGAYVSNGGYLMSIIATDRAGNTTTISDISISVNNNP